MASSTELHLEMATHIYWYFHSFGSQYEGHTLWLIELTNKSFSLHPLP